MPSPQIGRNTRELRDAKLLTCRLLQRLLDRQSSSGLPPAYLPKDDRNDDGESS